MLEASDPKDPATQLHKVVVHLDRPCLVLEDGVLFRGKRHRSLSEVARKITGNRWSGPLFFGLKAPVGANHDGTR